ncbi:hypothetical protein ES705_45879 [subsurface metagenome]
MPDSRSSSFTSMRPDTFKETCQYPNCLGFNPGSCEAVLKCSSHCRLAALWAGDVGQGDAW